MGRAQGQPALAATAVMHDMFDDLLGTRRGSQRPLAKRTDRDIPQYGLKITPSAAARRLAGQLWPDVQKQRRLAASVYGFTCAGHGGVIAVIGKAQLSPAHVAAARDAELTELVVIAPGKTYSTAAGYRRADLEALAVRPDCQSAELWVGEEDAGWATIFHEQAELLAGAINAGYLHDGVTMDDVSGTVKRWDEEYLAALYPDYRTEPGGMIDRRQRRQRRQRLLDGGEFLRSSAVGEGTGDEYRVRFMLDAVRRAVERPRRPAGSSWWPVAGRRS